MKLSQTIEFFHAVKGKKIRWSKWNKNQYFIPYVYYDDYMRGIDEKGHTIEYNIVFGFIKTHEGLCWEFYDKEIISHMPNWF